LLSGTQLKTAQTVMRYSTLTLAMDTYGHLLPAQEADAWAVLRNARCGNGIGRTGTGAAAGSLTDVGAPDVLVGLGVLRAESFAAHSAAQCIQSAVLVVVRYTS
jgi:hypothetical protein